MASSLNTMMIVIISWFPLRAKLQLMMVVIISLTSYKKRFWLTFRLKRTC